MELIGEWNDAIENDIMTLKREVIDHFQSSGINKFILIVENVLNFHSSDDSYYEEWCEDVKDKNGWAILVNMPEATQYDFRKSRLDKYIPILEIPNWRTYKPDALFQRIDNIFMQKIER